MPEWAFWMWLLASTLGAFVALRYFFHHLGREARKPATCLAVVLVVLVWLNPLSQHALARAAAAQHADAMAAFVGRPFDEVAAVFGRPIDGQARFHSYPARPWYAPLALAEDPAVLVICLESEVVKEVIVDA